MSQWDNLTKGFQDIILADRGEPVEATDDEVAEFLSDSQEPVGEVLEGEHELEGALRRLGENRDKKKELELALKEVNKDIKADQLNINATFDARGITKIALKGVGLFYQQSRVFPSIKDKQQLIAWFDQHGEPGLAPRTVNFQTLRAWWKTTMEHSGELPPENVATAFMEREVRLRKG